MAKQQQSMDQSWCQVADLQNILKQGASHSISFICAVYAVVVESWQNQMRVQGVGRGLHACVHRLSRLQTCLVWIWKMTPSLFSHLCYLANSGLTNSQPASARALAVSINWPKHETLSDIDACMQTTAIAAVPPDLLTPSVKTVSAAMTA